MKWHYPIGSTPLEPDEISGLIPIHITTQAQLNEWEQSNILEAELWITQHAKATDTILAQSFVQQLHKKMFNKTWKWAGQFRKSDKNIGVDWQIIPTQLQLLLDDVKYHIKHQTYSIDKMATRFHHRMVAIHPFANGNGRHARLITDTFLLSLHQPRFTWGKINLTEASQTRMDYIKSLRAADQHDYDPLRKFVRS
jgi:Fic-DOC domain mobile mystery protein B